jgi:catechol 2,3-dioxygenase-like lactoylglutathione lyase family enzyme
MMNIHLQNMAFYKEFFGFLGWSVLRDLPDKFGAGDRQGTSVWFTGPAKDVQNDYDGAGMNHLAILVDSQAEVDEAVAYLKEHKIQTLFDTPRHRPEFCHSPGQTYYQVMFASPDHILLEVVYKGPAT